MRTTLTLDPDVAMKLKKSMAENKITFKEAVNQTLRRGMKAAAKEKKRAPFKVIPHSFGFKPGIDQNKLNQLLDQMDAEKPILLMR